MLLVLSITIECKNRSKMKIADFTLVTFTIKDLTTNIQQRIFFVSCEDPPPSFVVVAASYMVVHLQLV
jgi:hypothetical protein